MEVITRNEARQAGHKRYYNGIPCKAGHTSERFTINGSCVQCTNERVTTSRASDPEKSRRQDATYRARRIEKRREHSRKYYAENAIELREASRARRAKDLEKARDSDRRHYAARRDVILEQKAVYRASHPEKVRAAMARWCQANPNYWTAANALRRAAIRERVPVWFGEFDEFVIDEAFDLCRSRLEATGIAWHVDHMVPLRARNASGLHCAHNLQVIPAWLNRRKKNRMQLTNPGEWIGQLHG